jgi:DNA-binding transcriptional LysR family regulator
MPPNRKFTESIFFGIPSITSMLNLHHLELFYYVAKHEGIVPACRHIPYGVQQPAVSAQIIRLEEDLGVSLFRRRPFQLTPAGRMLFDQLAPFFGGLPELEARLRGETIRTLRLAGLSEVMRDHAPGLLAGLKARHPGLQLVVLEAGQKQAEQLILRGEADLAVTVLDATPPAGLQCKRLLRLPLVLLVPESAPWLTAATAIKDGDDGKVDLISLGAHELLPRLFARGLRKSGREWPTTIAISSADLIAPYVSAGLGVGLSVSTPHRPPPAGLRELPLKGFPSLDIGAFWTGRLSPPAQELIAELAAIAASR